MHDLKDRLQLMENKGQEKREMREKAYDMIEQLTGPQESLEEMIMRLHREAQESNTNIPYQPLLDRMHAKRSSSKTLASQKKVRIQHQRQRSGVKLSTVNLRAREDIYGDDDFGFQIPPAMRN